MNSTLPRSFVRPLFALGLLFAFACGDDGGDGCACGGAGEGEAPYVFEGNFDDHVVYQGAQVHVSQTGLDTVAGLAPDLAGDLLGDGGLSFCLEAIDDLAAGIGLCDDGRRCAGTDGEPGPLGCDVPIEFGCFPCEESLDCPGAATCEAGACVNPGATECVTGIDIQARADGGTRVVARAFLDLDVTLRTTSFIEDCNLSLRSAAGGLPVSANVYFDVGPPPRELVSVDIPAEEIAIDTDRLIIELNDGFLCDIGDFFLGLVESLIVDQITGPIEDLIGPLLCTACEGNVDCPEGSSCQGGVCQFDGSDECVPIELGIETEFALGDLLSDFAPGSEANLGILAFLANYADGNGPRNADLDYYGLDLALEAGFYAEADPCVPYQAPPPVDRVPKSDAINAATTPAGDPFGVGIGVSRSALDLAAWAAYRSGALCVQVGTDFVEQISTGTFGLLLPSLSELTSGDNREMYIAVLPKQAPTVEFGAGTVDDEGNIIDPLLTLFLENVDLDFYAFAEERFVRILTLNVDLQLPLSLDVNEANEIIVVLGDLGNAITRVEAGNAQLLAQSDVDQISVLLPTLIATLLPALGGDLIPPIALPSFAGVSIEIPPGGITSVDDNEMLAIFADLAPAPPEASEKHEAVAAILALDLDYGTLDSADRIRARRAAGELVGLDELTPTLRVDLEIDGRRATAAHEWQYRVGDGLWSRWLPGDAIDIRDVRFALDGEYTLDVRVRAAGDRGSISANHARATVLIDRGAPALALEPVAGGVRVDARDHQALGLRFRVDGGAWRSLDQDRILEAGASVEVEARDASGNVSRVRTQTNEATLVAAPQPSPSAGCATSGRAPAGPLAMLALLGLVALRRRREVGVALLALMVSACGSSPSESDPIACDPECEEGFECIDGACEPLDTGCADDSECDGDLLCIDGACVEPTAEGCASNDECAEGELCVEGECVPDEPSGCTSDEECEDGECVDGECVPFECVDASDCSCPSGEVARCDDNTCACEAACLGGCGDAEACCADTRECVEVVADCPDADCGPGFANLVVGEASFDDATCEVVFECSCQELPPLEAGDFGEWLDVGVAPDGSSAVVATYNRSYGDLMVGALDGEEIAWSYVDGVPLDEDVVGSVNGPRGGIDDDGDDVGRYASIEMDAAGGLHVAYQAFSGEVIQGLKYAYGAPGADGFTWTTIAIDDEDNTGLYADLVLDDAGLPVIAYVANRVFDPELSVFFHEIRTVAATSATPASADDFGAPSVAVRSAIQAACGQTCGSRRVCRLDVNRCASSTDVEDCGGCGADEECFENEDGSFACSPFEASPATRGLLVGAGIFLDAEWLGEGQLGLAYYNSEVGSLSYASGAPGEAFAVETIDGAEAAIDAGWHPDLYVDPNGVRWIAYGHSTYGELRVAQLEENSITVVDDGFRCSTFSEEEPSACVEPTQGRVGDDAAVWVGDAGAYVVYQNTSTHEVLESPLIDGVWDVGSTLEIGAEEGDDAYGFYLGQGADESGRFVVTRRLNLRADPPIRDVVVLRR